MSEFKDFELRTVSPDFDSGLTDTLMELNHLRRMRLAGSTAPWIFFQLKGIFHLLESVGSARIEGNHTTISEYVEQKIEKGERSEDRFSEIANVEEAMSYIEDNIKEGSEITHHFIRELHQLAVTGLEREGDRTPGAYRVCNVSIASSKHVPPSPSAVQSYMDELLAYVNEKKSDKYDLLKTAVAHHRFTWVHPFSNGNGRVVRLLTYALLIKYGFNVKEGKLINPTAVFCNAREKYYEMLGVADTGTNEGLLSWCEYVLEGIHVEITKVNKLLDRSYLIPNILIPTLEFARGRQHITEEEFNVLKRGIASGRQEFRAEDVSEAIPGIKTRQRSHLISKMKESGFIQPFKDRPRTYFVSFTTSILMRSLISHLEKEGFIPAIDS